jgi:hypothetical protein
MPPITMFCAGHHDCDQEAGAGEDHGVLALVLAGAQVKEAAEAPAQRLPGSLRIYEIVSGIHARVALLHVLRHTNQKQCPYIE